jgi:cytochrome P450
MSAVMQTAVYPAGPKLDFVGGHLLSLRRDALGFMMNNLPYGDLVGLKFMKFDAYQLNHPDLVGQVLTKDNAIWHKSIVYKSSLQDYIGEGLLNADGDFWRRQRKLMQPSFHVKRIDAYAETMVDYAIAMLAGWQDGEERDIAADMMQVTLNVVGKTLFDADLSERSSTVAHALEFMLEDIIASSQSIIRLPEWMPTPARMRRKDTIEQLDSVILPMIEARRKKPEDRGDLLSMLLLAQDDEGAGMSDRQLRNEVLTLILAGHETTANALSWTFYLLSQNPDVARKLEAEADTVLGARRPNLADLKAMPYSEQVIKEAMRLYPPVWSVGRQNTVATTLGGYAVRRGSTAIIPIWALHHDERHFPDAECFMPERWTEDMEAALPRYAYLPFGGGPRICIGNAFAMMEARLLLMAIVQQYRLVHVAGHRVEPEPLVTLRPRYGMRMRMEKRSLASQHFSQKRKTNA